MSKKSQPSFRLMMTWVPRAGLGELDNAIVWHEKVNAGSDVEIEACIWTTSDANVEIPSKYRKRFCWHHLALPATVDRYIRGPIPRGLWSPWGNKSGPNFQFFLQLDETAQLHPEPWILQIEGDTFSVSDSPRESIEKLLTQHADAWVIGAVNHPAVLLSLPGKYQDHVNGAALYNVGSTDFREFRKGVWVPALIESVARDPELAYDVISSTGLFDEMSSRLRGNWQGNAHRFIRTPGIVNASSLSFEDPSRPQAEDLVVDPSSGHTAAETWLFHAKQQQRSKGKM